jgi:SAM-dependent methyltransferase
MDSAEVKKAILIDRLGLPPRTEALLWKEHEKLLGVHQEVVNARLAYLEAFRFCTRPILEEHLHQNPAGQVIEVGCGTGFFSRFLAPDWLKGRLSSFDIHLASLDKMREKQPGQSLFQANAYHLPFPNESLAALIGYSSFDSFLHLERALIEALRVIRPGGKLILFQDLVAEIYDIDESLPREAKAQTVERYHEILVEEAKKCGFILERGEDQDDLLTEAGIEPIKTVSQRVEDFEIEAKPFPVLALWDRGSLHPTTIKRDREAAGMTKEELDKMIDDFNTRPENLTYYQKMGAKAGDLVEMVVMRYLVAERPEEEAIPFNVRQMMRQRRILQI